MFKTPYDAVISTSNTRDAMNMSDETHKSSLATPKPKLLWTTPRVVPLLADVGTQGGKTAYPVETLAFPGPRTVGPS